MNSLKRKLILKFWEHRTLKFLQCGKIVPQNVSNKNSNPHKSELIGPTNPNDGRTSPLETEPKKK